MGDAVKDESKFTLKFDMQECLPVPLLECQLLFINEFYGLVT
jgi:hypothetical protein